jgi:hypothetical protein
MAKQRSAAAAARYLRADYLMAVTTGILRPLDVIDAAVESSNRALRTVRMSYLFGPLVDDLDDPEARTKHVPWRVVKRRLLEALDLSPRTPDKELTVGWLLDPRAGGKRWYALHDALRARDQSPWPGFPWAPPP